MKKDDSTMPAVVSPKRTRPNRRSRCTGAITSASSISEISAQRIAPLPLASPLKIVTGVHDESTGMLR